MTKKPRFQFRFGGKTYTFDAMRDLTASNVRHFKGWFGPDLGRVNPFVVALVQGDPDAWACAIWAARKAAGETNVPEPRNLPDFSVWELMADFEDAESEEEGEGSPEVQAPVPTQTPSGSET